MPADQARRSTTRRPARCSRPSRPAAPRSKAGDKVTLLVSAGFPQLAFDDDKNIQLVNGANGKKLDPIAKGPAREKDPTFSPDGTRVAYTGGGRVFLKDLEKPDAPAIPLTRRRRASSPTSRGRRPPTSTCSPWRA